MKELIYSKFSNERNRAYAIRTDIFMDGDNRYVRKTPAYPEARQHLARMVKLQEILNSEYSEAGFVCNKCHMDGDDLWLEYVNAKTLEETIDLRTAPRTLILYGHNMKSGAMFACLRRYEDPAFYRANPFIRVDTLYEDGLYVVVAAAVISGKEGTGAWVDLSRLCSSTTAWRREEIEKLMALSVFTRTVDAEPGDRLLLLITCAGDGDERRVVLARMLRRGETEADMARLVFLAERKEK